MDAMPMSSQPMSRSDAMKHMDHVDYPASKEDLVKACNNMSDVSNEDKKWFMESLPEGSYNSPDEVKEALGSSM